MLSDALPAFSYEGAASPGAALDPRLKILGAFVFVVGVLLGRDALQFAVLGLLIAAALAGARVPVLLIWTNLRPIIAFLLLGATLTALTTPGRGWTFGPAHVSEAGLTFASRLSVQLVLLLAATTVVTYTTAPFAIANALRQLLGFLERVRIPIEDMTTMLTVAITFVPIMSREIDRYLMARAARGGQRGLRHQLGLWSVLGDMVVPLIESNLRRGDELAMALDTRLYGYARRTHRGDTDIEPRSVLALFGVGAVIALTLTFL